MESTNLIDLMDDAIQSTIESSDFYDSLENALSQVPVLEQHLEVARSDLEDSGKTVQKLTSRLENEVRLKEELQQHLERLSEQLKNLEEEAGLTTYQLHQVQEKLEYYFILTSKQSKMLDKSAKLQERTVILLANANH